VADAPQQPAAKAPAPRIDGLADWEAWIQLAELGGPAGQLARHALPKSFQGDVLTLALTPEHMIFCSDALCHQLQEKLGEAIGRPLRVRVVSGEAVAETPAARAAQARAEQQAAAERAMADDPIVQDFQRQLGAEIIPESIRPAGTRA
jgi:DNA polymerase-3 subunit gamma/tau